MTLRLAILPVYSAEHPDPHYHIGSMQLLKHQVATWEAFQDPDVDVIFNTAMTGDGKSLAAYLPAFREGKTVIGMYPTNELVQDQHNALPKYEERLGVRLPRYSTMYSDRITRLMREHDNTIRLEEVRKLLQRNGILLTNSDLIHLMLSHQYGWDHLRKELPITIGAYFDYFLFDEFHVFGVPQVISVMNMLGYLTVNYRDRPADRKKFVFLSATPSQLMNDLLERGGLRYKKITGSYLSAPEPGYRCILQRCELELHDIQQDVPTETWIEERLEGILAFFKQHEDSKAAILVYSVATARRIYARLKEYFEPHGITVGENTGLTQRDERRAAFEKHILVGTSTVDIGVDFRINYLIFEAYNAGSFLQRFGRLGRHAGFSTYRAYGLVPRFVRERLTEKLGAVDEVERERFNEAIREAFPLEAEFKSYTQRWGVVQAAQVLAELQSQSKKDANDAFIQALSAQYEQFYCAAGQSVMPRAVKKYRGIRGRQPEIIEELSSFRGLSPLSCGVWDTDDHLQTYDLFFLLVNTEFEVLTGAEFMREVARRGLEEKDFRDQLLYLKIHRYIPERQHLILGLPYDLGDYASSLHHVQVLDNFFVREPFFTWRDQVNKSLKAKSLTCILSDMGRKELKQRLNLGSMFPIQRLQDQTGAEYSLAFGQEALLLDSLLFWRKTRGDQAMYL
ncbi:MAG: type I-D CRISPR-associated helicase Cas3' [Ktedonobacteraceae bacterium]